MTGASTGIGYELAKQFAQNGFDLLVTSTGSSINEAAIAFKGLGAKVETVQADLTTYEGVEMLYHKIKAIGQPVDAIAINAGVNVNGREVRREFATN
ncbi:MAG: SDR family oxidoreductase [Aulosira sp. DedQUE10]|nr:SDR family oxidoreductase [Aulosira sp. DedQUE10]